MKKKLVLLVVVVMIIALTLCACNGGMDNSDNINDNHNNGDTDNTGQMEDNDERDKEEVNNNDESNKEDNNNISSMYMYINGTKLEIILEDNTAVKALIDLLKEGDIEYTAHNYGGFEKVGDIGHNLPTNNTQINAVSGDVMLYQGRQMVVFYGSNSWSYTRIGRINNYSSAELKKILGNNNTQVRISLVDKIS